MDQSQLTSLHDGISDNPFPGTDISQSEKAKRKTGVMVGRAIEARFRMYAATSQNFERIDKNRRLASNSQSIDYYKPLIDPAYSERQSQQGQGKSGKLSSKINIDWGISSPAKKFVNSVVGMMIESRHSLMYNAIDRNSRAEKEAKTKELLASIYLKDILASQKIMNPLGGEEAMLTSKEDVEVYMEMTYKQRKALAMEQLVDHVLKSNRYYEQIEPRVLHDAVENNKQFIRTNFDKNNRIKINYGDIQSYIGAQTDYPTNENVEYDAEYLLMTVAEIRDHVREYEGPDKEREREVEEILFGLAQKFKGQYGNPGRFEFDVRNIYSQNFYWNDFRIPVILFNWYTIDKSFIRFKEKKGTVFVEHKDGNMDIPKGKEHEYKADEEETIYEGLYVPGTSEVFGYGKQRNICRPLTPNGKSWRPVRRFIFTEPGKRNGTSTSMVDDIEQSVHDFQIHSLKMRHIVSQAAPPGFYADWSAMTNLILDGEAVHPKELFALFRSQGIVLGGSVDEEGGRKPITFQDLKNGVADSLRPHIEAMGFAVQHIREITGVNDAVDGSVSNSNALVGIQRMKAMSANRLLRELFDSYSQITFKRLGEALRDMIQTQIEYGMCEEEYRSVIGDELYEQLKYDPGEPFPLFGVHVASVPDQDEIASLQNFIQIGLENGTVSLSDVADIKRISNVKLIEQKLKYRERKRQEEKMQELQAAAEFEAQKNQSAAESRVMAEKEIIKADMEAKMAVENQRHENKMSELSEEITLKGANEIREINLEAVHKGDHIRLANSLAAQQGERESGGSNLARTPGIIPTPPKKATSPNVNP
jgi:hypothetical protein